ncbi:IncP-type conjugal transfer protein TrbI [Brucella sp. C7-11G]
MVQSLQLGNPSSAAQEKGMKRLNRLPVFFGIGIAVVVACVLVYGISSRGLRFGDRIPDEAGSNVPASTFADQMKRGVKDGIIGDHEEQPVFQPTPTTQTKVEAKPIEEERIKQQAREERRPQMESEEEWLARLRREQREQVLREQQRQRMASLQARATAFDSPLKVKISELGNISNDTRTTERQPATNNGASDLYAAAMKSGLVGQNVDPNGQIAKEDFFNADIKDLGYLPNQVVPQQSRYELKRGSVIPATMITGIMSDLPGRITAQVSQHIYDSATGHFLLIPQGTKLLGRYDSKVSFGQSRVLVVWTDVIFPNGSTLQIGGMAGTDSQGYGGFSDKVNNHYFRTFGSAALVALIGTGIDMAVPESSTLATQDTASDAARRNFAETFGRVAEQTISKNLNVQPTIQIRPGYKFNVLVDQDIVFPGNYGG